MPFPQPTQVSQRLMPQSHQTLCSDLAVKCWGLCWEIDVHPPLFILLQPKMLMDGAISGRCDQPLMPRWHQIFRLVLTMKLLGIMLRNRWWPTTFQSNIVGDVVGWCHKWPVWSTPQAPITPNFLFGSNRGIVGDYVEKWMLAHHFSHYFSRRCCQSVPQVANVINPSGPDHTKLSVWILSWNCWGLCWGTNVGPSFFTLLQPEILTDGATSGRCDQPLKLRSHQTFRLNLIVKLLGIILRTICWPTGFHPTAAGDVVGWCHKWPVWSAPQPDVPNQTWPCFAMSPRRVADGTHVTLIFFSTLKAFRLGYYCMDPTVRHAV